MKSLDRILKIAERFEDKITSSLAAKYAQQSAQSGDIQDALTAAGLWELSAAIAPMLSTVGIADDAKVAVFIDVDNALNVTYPVVITPPNPGQAFKLAAAIKVKYGNAMKNALTKAGLHVTDKLQVNWINF